MSTKSPTGDRPRSASDYASAIHRLYSLEFASIRLGLDNISKLCRALGDPQDRFVCIHIAGTNGKGSVCAMLDAILRAAGHRTGRFTSPHLRDLRERVLIDGRPVPRGWVQEFLDRHWTMICRERFSFFETMTAFAFDSFARANIDIAVIEVGLGGRLDATNIITPALSVITRIAADHQHLLGDTPAKIAVEKAGIVKEGVGILTGPLAPEASAAIAKIAESRHAPIWDAHELMSDRGSRRMLPGDGEAWRTPLVGPHQTGNAAIAIAAAVAAEAAGIPISPGAVRFGLRLAHCAARFQVLAGRPTTVFDAAHNPDGMRALVSTWRSVFGSRRAVLLVAIKEDKDYRSMLRTLRPVADALVSCPLPVMPGVGQAAIAAIAERRGLPFVWEETPRQAFSRARQLAGPDGIVLVTGSHFLIGEIIPAAAIFPPPGPNGVFNRLTRRGLLQAAADPGEPFGELADGNDSG
ncbi:MAG TPA: Mur ligase family protein [candidate division Zixibacteria bacterium]|jgi:dihydrofolate synthase/folylpolyglutamate synthase